MINDSQNCVVLNVIEDNYVIDLVYKWNTHYPVDRWWRQKHNIAWNSQAHRVVSFIDMRFEFEEDKVFEDNRRRPEYLPNTGDWFEPKITVEEDSHLTEAQRKEKYIKEFSKIDLSQFND